MALGLLSRLKQRQTLGGADAGISAGEFDPTGGGPSGGDPTGADPNSGGLPGDTTGADPNGAYGDPTGADPNGAYGNPDGSEPASEQGGLDSLPDAVAGPDSFSASTPNTPLAIPGTFALPGSAGAGQFRSRNFMMNRGMGGEQADYAGKKRRFGAGVPVSGSSASLGIDPEELTRRILNR
jgi:hypothetical protein